MYFTHMTDFGKTESMRVWPFLYSRLPCHDFPI